MPTRRKSAEAIRSQQTRFLAFFSAVVALVVLIVAAILPAVGPAEDLPLYVEDQDPAQFQELQQLRPEGDGWSEGLASAYSLETNDGWDETASGIPLNNYALTVAVPQENKDLLGSNVEIFYAGKTVEAKVTDTGALAPLGRARGVLSIRCRMIAARCCVLLDFAAGDTKLALYGTHLLFCPLAA